MLATVRRLAFSAPSGVRGVAYVASKASSPVRGLKKDPEDYMSSHSGVRYPGTPDTLEPARRFLGEFSLPDNLLLQCLVHKSFAHGKVPYNEKLAILGQQMFRFEAHRKAAEVPNVAPENTSVNKKNFDIVQNAVELLASTPVLSAVCDKAQLEPAMFYKSADGKLRPTIKAKTIQAFVGALSLERGAPEAMRFMNTRLMAGEYNIFEIADRLFVHN